MTTPARLSGPDHSRCAGCLHANHMHTELREDDPNYQSCVFYCQVCGCRRDANDPAAGPVEIAPAGVG